MNTFAEQGVSEDTVALRSRLLGHRGAVIWLTGLSGAGKSTLARALERRLLRSGTLATVLDGDLLRNGLCSDLSFSDEQRKENIRRAAEAALLVAQAGLVAITALISPFRQERASVGRRCHAAAVPFAEVFVNAPFSECESRDPKGLYRRARAGQIASFTGLTSAYEAPLAPDLELRTHEQSIPDCVRKLARLALEMAGAPKSSRPVDIADIGETESLFSETSASNVFVELHR